MIDRCEISPQDLVVAPGYIIRQRDDRIISTYPNGKPYFSVKCKQLLSNFRLDHQTYFGYDINGHVHIFPFESNQPTVVQLQHRPHGWCIVPKTSFIVHWNVLTLTVTDTVSSTHRNLRGHLSKVICGDATTTVVVTGDRTGHMCIWYAASWTCHHYIKTGSQICQQVLLHNSDQVAVRTRDNIFVYDVTSGILASHFPIVAKDMQWCSFGLVAVTSNKVYVYKDGELAMCFKHSSTKLIRSNHNRVWSISKRQLFEFRFNDDLVHWPKEVIDWIRAPTFPVELEQWPKRYLDVLAISTKQWVPLVGEWDPPRIWFRHTGLRDAIWDTILDIGRYAAAESWDFLPHEAMHAWYAKCEQKLNELVQLEEFSTTTLDLISLTYQHLNIRTDAIIKWCWLHHGQNRLRSILMYFTDHDFDGQFMYCISRLPSTPDSILCFTAVGANLAFRNGFFVIFLKWFREFHLHYPYEPTHHMKEIFSSLLTHVYRKLDHDSIDIPLRESGEFESIEQLKPSHARAYVRQGNRKGFVTKVDFGENERAEWAPIGTSVPIELDVKMADVWKFHHGNVPHTILECALLVLDESIWSQQTNKKEFEWFRSDVGAFLTVGERIRVYDKDMCIERAGWQDAQRFLVTDSSLKILDSENLDMEWNSKLWSYIDENVYHIAPLRLKICHCVSLSTRKVPLPPTYAPELIQCFQSDQMQKEHMWNTESSVTAMTSESGRFFIGSRRGIVYEYENMACMEDVKRTFESHPNAIRILHVFGSMLLSMCEEQINVWDLHTGTKHFCLNTEKQYISIMPFKDHSFWLVEEHKQRHAIVLWDTITKTPIRRIDTSEYVTGTVIAISQPEPVILISDILYLIDQGKNIQLRVPGVITCIASMEHGICGGTADGDAFTMKYSEKHIESWSLTKGKAISAITAIPGTNIVILGSVDGYIYISDTDSHLHTIRKRISNVPIHCLYAESLFVLVASRKELHMFTVVPERAILSVHALNAVVSWSNAWKTRLLKETTTIVQPSVVNCLTQDRATSAALALVDECTLEYQDRGAWCSANFADLLLNSPGLNAHKIVRRLASFRGPRFDCAICADEEREDLICYLPCHHRFHAGCVAELIKKTPEFNDEMQYDYALTFSLKCPVCRTVFSPDDVAEDTLLNKYLHIHYKPLHYKPLHS